MYLHLLCIRLVLLYHLSLRPALSAAEPLVGSAASAACAYFKAKKCVESTAIFQLLQDMAAAGKTVLVVHHDIHSAMNFFDWVIMLNLHLVASGPKEQVMTEELLRKTYGGKLNLLTQVTDLIRKQDFNPLQR